MKLFHCDTETTGTDPKKHGLVQLSGVIEANNDIVTFDYRVKPFPTDVIDAGAMAVHKLDISEHDEPSAVYTDLVSMLGKYADKYNKKDKFFWVGYNAHFDFDFVREFFKKNGDEYFGSWFYFPPIDVMNLAMLRLMGRRAEMPNFKLATVAKELGIPIDEVMHDAFVDIRLTKLIFEKLTKEVA